MDADDARQANAPLVRVLVADDHPAVRTGLATVLAQESDFRVVAGAENGDQAIELSRQHRPDVVLMDIRMPGTDGIEATRVIARELPATRVLALTTYDGDADIRRALDAGAVGYLLKDMLLTDVINAVRAVHRGERVIPHRVAERLAEFPDGRTLTPRELEVLDLVARGLQNKQVAAAISRSDETVKLHLKNIFAKLGVGDRTQAVTAALSRGLIHLE